MEIKDVRIEQEYHKSNKRNFMKTELKSWADIMDEEEQCQNSKKRSDFNNPQLNKKKQKCDNPKTSPKDISYSIKHHPDYTIFVPVEKNKDPKIQDNEKSSLNDDLLNNKRSYQQSNKEVKRQRVDVKSNNIGNENLKKTADTNSKNAGKNDVKTDTTSKNAGKNDVKTDTTSKNAGKNDVKTDTTSKNAGKNESIEKDEKKVKNLEKQNTNNTEVYRKYIAEVSRRGDMGDLKTNNNSNRYFIKTADATSKSSTSKKDSKLIETDEQRIKNREKQIAIGKNTEGYRKYIAEVPRSDRTPVHPWTPDKYSVCSTRSWQGVMRIWRRKLHYWDPPHLVEEFETQKFCNVAAQSFDDCKDSEECNLSDESEHTYGKLDDFSSLTEEEVLFGTSVENY
nr:histone RNA hairpin-binding protein isoform X2 [Hydra vulgaris]